MSHVLVLTSSPLTDRMLRYSGWLPALAARTPTRVWALSLRAGAAWNEPRGGHVVLEPLPEVTPFHISFDWLRRLNEYAWDHHLRIPSRESAQTHLRDKHMTPVLKALLPAGRALARLRLHGAVERGVQRALAVPVRSPDAAARLRRDRPRLVVTTSPFRFDEPGVVAEALRLGIPTMAFITSWDNLSTKNRMPFRHDAFLVWSEEMRQQLLAYYPYTRDVPVHVCGAPQFDVFHDPRFRLDRRTFCAAHGLDAGRKIVVYALGSPNLIREHHGAIAFAEKVAAGELGDVQLLVRPHPQFDRGAEAASLRGFGPRVVVQQTHAPEVAVDHRSQDEAQIRDWVNTFRHADVVVNLSSTVAIDAALFDKPVVNLDYDPEPGAPQQQLVKDINHRWTHFAPIARSGGVWLTESFAETVAAVQAYLADPTRHAAGRRRIAEYVCGFTDGQNGARIAAAIAAQLGLPDPSLAGPPAQVLHAGHA